MDLFRFLEARAEMQGKVDKWQDREGLFLLYAHFSHVLPKSRMSFRAS